MTEHLVRGEVESSVAVLLLESAALHNFARMPTIHASESEDKRAL
jgi:hypothetical protein